MVKNRLFQTTRKRSVIGGKAEVTYRWEVIMRETAILGILGIATLGFFVNSAMADIRLDQAMFLIAVTAAFNIGIDILSRRIRSHLRLNSQAGRA